MTDPTDPDDDFDNEAALAELLGAGILFANSRRIVALFDTESTEETICLYVNCSDLFAWACADAESVPLSELPALYRAWKSGPHSFGVDKWCCLHRKERPQGPVERKMREAGAWDDAMEALPPNQDDIRLREYHERKAQEQAAHT